MKLDIWIQKSCSVEAQIPAWFEIAQIRQILKFKFEYYSSWVITPDLARYSYPSNSQTPNFFWVAKQGQVIRPNLHFSLWQKGRFNHLWLFLLLWMQGLTYFCQIYMKKIFKIFTGYKTRVWVWALHMEVTFFHLLHTFGVWWFYQRFGFRGFGFRGFVFSDLRRPQTTS